MNTDDFKAFTNGLKDLTDEYRSDTNELADDYKDELQESSDKFAEVYPQVKEAADQFETASHEFAQDMINRADKYVEDVAALYKSIYGESET